MVEEVAEFVLHDVLLGAVNLAGRVIARNRVRNVPYLDDGHPAHTLDVYRPERPNGRALLYVHGGGYRILSKDTHWVFGHLFASAGYTVFNINYRLSRTACFPGGLSDVMAAYAWVVRHAREYGADPRSLVVAGESAGGGLITALTIATCFRRPESFTRQVWDSGVVPRAVIPMCGHLQVSEPMRARKGRVPRGIVASRMRLISSDYLGNGPGGELMDPLMVLESSAVPERPLPPFLLSCGSRDPILDDTERLAAALTRRGVPHEAHYYSGELHAFQAMLFRKAARDYWQVSARFLAGLAHG